MGRPKRVETEVETEKNKPGEPPVESPPESEPVPVENKPEEEQETHEPAEKAEPRISLREFKGIYCQSAKTRARIRALEIVMDVGWLSTNKTLKQWLHFCEIVELAPVNELKLSEWIKLVTDGGTKEQKTRYAGILKQLEV